MSDADSDGGLNGWSVFFSELTDFLTQADSNLGLLIKIIQNM